MSEIAVVHDDARVFSWRPADEGAMQRAAHALRIDDDLWVIDPIDVAGLDAHLEERGRVAGIVITLNRHVRDSAAMAERHGVEVWADEAVGKVDLGSAGRRYRRQIPDTPFATVALPGTGLRRWWHEAALWWPAESTLLVSESLGTVPSFRLGDEEVLGLHPLRRGQPPTELAQLAPELLLVGHGDPVEAGAAALMADVLSRGPRRRRPFWLVRSLWAAR